LYLDVTQYGTSYMVISSETRVTVAARLVDLRNGKQLWAGTATASSNEGNNNSGGLLGMVISAAISQIADTISDKGF
ncbi:GNA1162 family protein, partial [Serratia marcescens]